MLLTGNTVLITGGSSGIGLALAKRFLSLKNKVIITGRDQKKLDQIKNEYPEIEVFVGDLTNQNSLEELVLFIEHQHADLKILINNAAVQYTYNFIDEPNPLNKIMYEVSTNLTAPLKLTSLILPVLLKNQSGAIVNVSSALFIAPKKSASVYCATKAALHSFSKTLRYQLEHTGINVFEIIPALVETPMTAGRGKSKLLPEQLVDEFLKDFQANRFESYIGKTKLLKIVQRLSPRIADRIMKNG